MKIAFIGTTKFSELALKKLIELGENVVAVFTKEKSDFHSDYAPLKPVCEENEIPCYNVENVNGYGFKEVFRLDIEPTKVKEFPFGKLVEMISNVVKAVKPDVVYVHNRSDVHSDHRVSFEAVMSAVKIFNNPYIRSIFMYETLSETNFTPSLLENAFIPNYYVDISDFLDVKVQIAEIYKSEIKEHPFPRSRESIRALAILSGSEANVKYAEAFILLGGIW